MFLLKVSGLTKVFNLHLLNNKQVTACRDISFCLRTGEVLGILGPSGAGKSTILKCIYRTYLPTSGEIVYRSAFGAVDLARAKERLIISLRRREIAYVPQFLRVIPRICTLEVVAEGLLRRGQERNKAFERAREYLGRLEVPAELWEASPATFSGGEQQRVNIARAAAMQPKLILLDEPTASLDEAARGKVHEILRELKAKGVTMVIVSHDRAGLEQIADRMLFLGNGHEQHARRGKKYASGPVRY